MKISHFQNAPEMKGIMVLPNPAFVLRISTPMKQRNQNSNDIVVRIRGELEVFSGGRNFSTFGTSITPTMTTTTTNQSLRRNISGGNS